MSVDNPQNKLMDNSFNSDDYIVRHHDDDSDYSDENEENENESDTSGSGKPVSRANTVESENQPYGVKLVPRTNGDKAKQYFYRTFFDYFIVIENFITKPLNAETIVMLQKYFPEMKKLLLRNSSFFDMDIFFRQINTEATVEEQESQTEAKRVRESTQKGTGRNSNPSPSKVPYNDQNSEGSDIFPCNSSQSKSKPDERDPLAAKLRDSLLEMNRIVRLSMRKRKMPFSSTPIGGAAKKACTDNSVPTPDRSCSTKFLGNTEEDINKNQKKSGGQKDNAAKPSASSKVKSSKGEILPNKIKVNVKKSEVQKSAKLSTKKTTRRTLSPKPLKDCNPINKRMNKSSGNLKSINNSPEFQRLTERQSSDKAKTKSGVKTKIHDCTLRRSSSRIKVPPLKLGQRLICKDDGTYEIKMERKSFLPEISSIQSGQAPSKKSKEDKTKKDSKRDKKEETPSKQDAAAKKNESRVSIGGKRTLYSSGSWLDSLNLSQEDNEN